MLAKITEYFLGVYDDSSYVVKQKSKVILIICAVVFIITPVILAMNILTGQTAPEINLPLIVILIIIVVGVMLLKSGRFSVVAHMIFVISLAGVWATLFFRREQESDRRHGYDRICPRPAGPCTPGGVQEKIRDPHLCSCQFRPVHSILIICRGKIQAG
jgi:hypothetical protein